MKVLFLDIDGVLNSTEYSQKVPRRSLVCDPTSIDPESCLLLQSLFEKHQDLVVVISSTWRKALSIDELREVLSEKGLDARRIVEFTPVLHGQIRGQEILSWLRTQSLKSNFPVTSIAILDDDADMGSLLPWLVQTDVDKGLKKEDLSKIQDMFKKEIPNWLTFSS